jgi:hypothetical protein
VIHNADRQLLTQTRQLSTMTDGADRSPGERPEVRRRSEQIARLARPKARS